MKATLQRILTTLIPPISGSVSFLGYDIRSDTHEVRKNICIVLQENAVELYLSVVDNLATCARFHSVPSHQISKRVEGALAQFGPEYSGSFSHKRREPKATSREREECEVKQLHLAAGVCIIVHLAMWNSTFTP